MNSRSITQHCTFLILVTALFVHADLAPQQNITPTLVNANTLNASWQGIDSRTYFLQTSLDMYTWRYAPMVEFGNGTKSHNINTQGAPKFFLRLQYMDSSGISTLQEARDADFNGNGIPNSYEVESLLSDPIIQTNAPKNTDGDLMNDAEEYLAGRDPLATDQIADATSRELDVFNLNSF
jgi:hypothetical protein